MWRTVIASGDGDKNSARIEKHPTTEAPFPDFDDLWSVDNWASIIQDSNTNWKTSEKDMASAELDNSLPAFPRILDGFNSASKGQSDGSPPQISDVLAMGNGKQVPSQSDNHLNQILPPDVMESVGGDDIQFLHNNQLDNVIIKQTTEFPTPLHLNGESEAMLGHFHPHFGMIDHDSLPKRPPVKGAHSVEGTFLWAIGLFGTVENGAIFLTAIFSKRFKQPLHLLIGTLSSTDLFISAIYIPSYTYFLLEGGPTYLDSDLSEIIPNDDMEDYSNYSFCNISRSIFLEIASVTLTIKTLIALYLYVLTKSRELAKKLFTYRSTAFFILIAWCLNFLMLFLPTFIGHEKVDFYPTAFVCSKNKNAPKSNIQGDATINLLYSLTTLFIHFVELIFISVCFMKVHSAIMKGKFYTEKHRGGDKLAKLTYSRATKITILVFMSFAICWLPIYIINMVDPEHNKIPDGIHHLVMDLLLLKSAINPTIYIYGIRSLRYEMRLFCMCRCRDDPRRARLKEHIKPSSYFLDQDSGSTGGTVYV